MLVPFFPLVQLILDLTEAGVRVSIDPSRVNPPGVWLRMGPITVTDTLCGEYESTMTAEAVCVVGDTTDEAALLALVKLTGLVEPHVMIVGPLRFQGTVLPGPDLTALPSVVLPITLGP